MLSEKITPAEAIGVALSVFAGSKPMYECQEAAPDVLEHLQNMGFDVKPIQAPLPAPEVSIAEAVQALTKALKEDNEYRHGWEANITMAFVDHFDFLYAKHSMTERKLIVELARGAAAAFIDQFIGKDMGDADGMAALAKLHNTAGQEPVLKIGDVVRIEWDGDRKSTLSLVSMVEGDRAWMYIASPHTSNGFVTVNIYDGRITGPRGMCWNEFMHGTAKPIK